MKHKETNYDLGLASEARQRKRKGIAAGVMAGVLAIGVGASMFSNKHTNNLEENSIKTNIETKQEITQVGKKVTGLKIELGDVKENVTQVNNKVGSLEESVGTIQENVIELEDNLVNTKQELKDYTQVVQHQASKNNIAVKELKGRTEILDVKLEALTQTPTETSVVETDNKLTYDVKISSDDYSTKKDSDKEDSITYEGPVVEKSARGDARSRRLSGRKARLERIANKKAKENDTNKDNTETPYQTPTETSVVETNKEDSITYEEPVVEKSARGDARSRRLSNRLERIANKKAKENDTNKDNTETPYNEQPVTQIPNEMPTPTKDNTTNAYEIVKTPKTDTKWTPYAGIFTGFKYPIVADENLGAIPIFGIKCGSRTDKLGIYGTLSIAETNETERTDTSYATLDSTSFDIGVGIDYDVFDKDKLNVRVGGGPRLSIENNRGRIDVNEASLDINNTETIFGGEVFGEANYDLTDNLNLYLNLGVGGNFSGDNSNTDVDGKVLFGLNYEF